MTVTSKKEKKICIDTILYNESPCIVTKKSGQNYPFLGLVFTLVKWL